MTTMVEVSFHLTGGTLPLWNSIQLPCTAVPDDELQSRRLSSFRTFAMQGVMGVAKLVRQPGSRTRALAPALHHHEREEWKMGAKMTRVP